jgi:hypothetical protein
LAQSTPFSQRERGIVFSGQTYQSFPFDRVPILNRLKQQSKISCNFMKPQFKSWYSYMNMIAKYQFVFSPLGNGNGFASRFYEALALKSIILQQVHDNTLQYYNKEAEFKNCIFFRDIDELLSKLNTYDIPEERSELWLEDVLEELLKEANLL